MIGFAFVSSPFTSADREVEVARYHRAVHFLGWATLEGMIVFSPVVHSFAASTRFALPTDFSFWLKANMAFLRRASGLIVLALDGWEASGGVAAERAEARRLGMPQVFFEPQGDGWVQVPLP